MGGAARGFTLLEVLLAMVIFGLVTVSVLMTFRTATRTYERSGQAMEALQAVRAVTDRLGRDLRGTFLVNETNYGVPLPQEERRADGPGVTPEDFEAREEARRRLEAQGIVDFSLGQSEGLLTEEQLSDPSLDVELQFTVEDGGESDRVTLVRRHRPAAPPGETAARRSAPWGLSRLTYFVDEEQLIRETAPVFREVGFFAPRPGETLDEARARFEEENPPPEPRREVMAQDVVLFDVHCLFWADGEWRVCDQWDSEAQQFRNPYTVTDIVPGDAAYPMLRSLLDALPPDGLPSAVEVTLGLRDRLSGRVRTSRLLVPVLAAQETWAPADPRLLQSLPQGLGDASTGVAR